jgi:deazaflavin-dependent oxidoreductase (nitroreductase family)
VPGTDEANARVIEAFRAGGGHLGGSWAGTPVVLLHHRGRTSGIERVTPLVFQSVPGGYAVFAAGHGAPDHPGWYRNLMAHPDTTVEIGAQTLPVHAREALGEERDRIFRRQVELAPEYGEFEAQAAPRVIPVVVLEPTG